MRMIEARRHMKRLHQNETRSTGSVGKRNITDLIFIGNCILGNGQVHHSLTTYKNKLSLKWKCLGHLYRGQISLMFVTRHGHDVGGYNLELMPLCHNIGPGLKVNSQCLKYYHILTPSVHICLYITTLAGT